MHRTPSLAGLRRHHSICPREMKSMALFPKPCLPAVLLSAALTAWFHGAQAQTPAGTPLSFEAAWNRVKSQSDKLAAAQAAVDHKALQEQGIEGLGRPSLSLGAASFAYSAHLDVSLDPVNQKLAQASGQMPVPLQNLPVPQSMPQLPAMYSYKKESTGSSASLSGIWPLYEGGAAEAARSLVGAQRDEAFADLLHTRFELGTLLTQRYFGAQLAAKAAGLREAALHNVSEHDAAAEKMLQGGLISKVERLQVRAAFEDARRNALKAREDANLAAAALARTLKLDGQVQAQTPLFVLSMPVESLGHFTEAALRNHPGLAKVAAKKSQAIALHEGQGAGRKPQVFVFGQHGLEEKNPDWVAGIGLRWTLYNGLDNSKLDAASAQQVAQAELTDAQARSDIALLVERNWRLLEQARRQFASLQPSVDLSLELLRLRKAAVREGTGTALELMDAETNAAKIQTERAQAAYEFDLALANLLESCGLSEDYATYVARADILVE